MILKNLLLPVMGIWVLCPTYVNCDIPSYTILDQCTIRKDDTKQIISLWEIDEGNKISFSFLQQEKPEYTIDYSPCTVFSKYSQSTPKEGCHDVLACQRGTTDDKGYNPVAHPGLQQVTLDGNQNVQFRYQGDLSSFNRKSIITLKCDPKADPKVDNVYESPQGTYNWDLTTKCACPGVCKQTTPGHRRGSGMSTGTALVIIFAVLLFLYFVGGVLFLKFVKHREGADVIPNREFWADFPAKVKDGCKFTVEKVRGRGSEYQQI